MAATFPFFNRITDTNGDPLSGALLYCYAEGTTTPLAVYSDEALTTPHANPVVADGDGLFAPIYLQALAYKFVAKTSAGVTLWTLDNYNPDGGTVTLGDLTDSLLRIVDDGDTSKKAAFQASGITTATTRTFTFPDYDGTFATQAGTETLTNKTIDSASNTITLDLSEGTLAGTLAEFNTAMSDGSFVSLAGSETLTNKTLTSPTIDLSTVTSSGDLAVADGGTGASTAATARTNLNIVQGITPEDYGAVGDSNGTASNGTDDTTAFQNALAAAGALGEPLVLTPGKIYRLTSEVVIRHSYSGIVAPYYRAATLFFDHTGNGIKVGDNDGTAVVHDTVLSDFIESQLSGSGFAIYQYHSRNIECFGLTGTVRNIAKLGTAAVAITGAVDNGSGLIRITATGHGFATGMTVMTNYVGGVTGAGAEAVVTVIDANTYDIQGSTFGGTYTSSGFAAPKAYWFVQRDCNLVSMDTTGIQVNSHAGSIAGYNSATEGRNSTGSLPTSGTKGLHFVRAATAYARVDYVQGVNWTISGYDEQIVQDNTRVVSMHFSGGIFDWCRSWVANFKNDNPDQTGGGCDDIKFLGTRCGLNGGSQTGGFRFDCSAVSMVGVQIDNFNGTFYEDGIEIIGGASTYLDEYQFTNMYFDLRASSGTYDGINVSTRIGSGIIDDFLIVSAAGVRDGVRVESGTAMANGELVVGQVLPTGSYTGSPITDTPGIATKKGGGVAGTKTQRVLVVMHNNGGTLRHKITSVSDESVAAPASVSDLINGASSSFTNTATGTNSSTAFTAGLKVDSTRNGALIFDTPAQINGRLTGQAVPTFNNSTTDINIQINEKNSDVNGTTRRRLYLVFADATAGTDIDWTAFPTNKYFYFILDVDLCE